MPLEKQAGLRALTQTVNFQSLAELLSVDLNRIFKEHKSSLLQPTLQLLSVLIFR